MSVHMSWKRLQQLANAYRVVALPVGVISTSTAVAYLYRTWHPAAYAQWYLGWISAGQFKEPVYEGCWVNNSRLNSTVKQALKPHPNKEQMTLISGLQISGKTSCMLKECHDQTKAGFFVDLGGYKGPKGDMAGIEHFVVSSLVSNKQAVSHNFSQRIMWFFFPQPDFAFVWEGLKGAFQQRPQQFVLMVDETQVLANKTVQHSGILNELCQLSPYGNVVLVASEYAVAQFFKIMTHVASRTTVVYAPLATAEEMRPHVKQCFEDDFGAKGAEEIVQAFEGSFMLLRSLDEDRSSGIQGVRKWHKEELVYKMQLTDGGLKDKDKAMCTGEAMLTTLKMIKSLPVQAFDKGTLELAQAGAAKIETVGRELTATWASPLTGQVMKELVMDPTTHAILEEKIPSDLWAKFKRVLEKKS